MEIETKFDVNNLVKRKFDKDSDKQMVCLEVMEITSQTCYAGTQVFYSCKMIVAQKEFKDQWKNEGDFSWVIGHNLSTQENNCGWKKYREDELIEAPKELVDLIIGIKEN